ncbi:probable inactive receptor kinase at4g23740 [Phtheirospermum japonicum]|uniref:Probable inactive receptor kinase at4g23740 n=1 Tax=Phtheirospermum japonicum TaxID=374723 RepID=A0A830B1V4_9LAMI|nr:probable inactive receptor kinase at4g23740 [Phtheirospermum japonicum]
MSAIYDNWERLVASVLKKEQIKQLCYAESFATSLGSLANTSSFNQSVLSQILGPISPYSQTYTTVVKRWRGSDIRHETVASYFSHEDEMLVIYEHQSLGGPATVLPAKAIANNHDSLRMDDVFSCNGLEKMDPGSIVIPTAGYRAPEVMNYDCRPSKASDVYSFGVMLIELLTGDKLVSRTRLARWAIHKFHQVGTLIVFDFVPVTDPDELIEMWKMFLVAMRCIEENPKMRPEMCDVSKMMEGIKTCPS